jgi:cellulose synthase/poly-beta-1,6-N-acetylglucosamine synthase-like glycosyltransferase
MLRDSISTKKIDWIFKSRPSTNRIAVLVPLFNEFSKGHFIERLAYFKQFAEEHSGLLDIIIVDDGSTDNSLEVMKWFIKNNLVQFNVVAITPNSAKIGALYLTALNIKNDYVLFTDFDTDLMNLDHLPDALVDIDQTSSLMGCYFRMVPTKGSSPIARYQQFEYAIHRKWYEYTSVEGSVAVMPGAGSIYKRKLLLKILDDHSGLLNGEDRETTVMGIKMGYQAVYLKQILVLTRTPKTIKELISQRIRWNLGYIETINKESEFYRKKIRSYTVIGLRTLFDAISIGSLLMFPVIIVLVGILNLEACLLATGAVYLLKTLWIYFISLIGKNEMEDFRIDYKVLFLYPILKVFIEIPSWSIAVYKFWTTDYRPVCQAKCEVEQNIEEEKVKSYSFEHQKF